MTKTLKAIALSTIAVCNVSQADQIILNARGAPSGIQLVVDNPVKEPLRVTSVRLYSPSSTLLTMTPNADVPGGGTAIIPLAALEQARMWVPGSDKFIEVSAGVHPNGCPQKPNWECLSFPIGMEVVSSAGAIKTNTFSPLYIYLMRAMNIQSLIVSPAR